MLLKKSFVYIYDKQINTMLKIEIDHECNFWMLFNVCFQQRSNILADSHGLNASFVVGCIVGNNNNNNNKKHKIEQISGWNEYYLSQSYVLK